MKNLYTLTLSVFVICAIAIFHVDCSRGGSKKRVENESTRSPENVQFIGNVSKVIDVAEGKGSAYAPNFSWMGEGGKKVELKDYKGSAVLINFWATWCGPCKKELPDLVSINDELKGKKFKLIGVSVDKGGEAVKEVSDFAQKNDLHYPIIVDEADQLDKAYGNIRGIPTTFLLDEDGKIVKTYVGAKTKEMFMQGIAQVLN
jgi:peroxiredoxin